MPCSTWPAPASRGATARTTTRTGFEHLNALLRRRVREDEGRRPEPTAMAIDAQSIKPSTNAPAAGQGIDVGKKIVGRKRSIVIDTTGLLLTALVTATSIQYSTAGETLEWRITS